MRPVKYLAVAERLSERIRNGDYTLSELPPERLLAEETGVSQMTARKAIKKLLDDGLLSRQANGRLDIRSGAGKKAGAKPLKHVALLAQAWQSREAEEWSVALARVAESCGCSCRLVHYFHNDDPAILNTLKRFDATFFLPDDPMPEQVVAELVQARRPLFILSSDWTHLGVPSLRMTPPVFTQRLLDHLAELGHRRIDCLNVQPSSTIIPARIAQWRLWLESHGCEGRLYDEPVEHYCEPLPAAYALTSRLAKAGELRGGALLCVTDAAAFGAIRALADNGLKAGEDIAVCSSDSNLLFEYSIPSVTALRQPDPAPFLSVCLKWLREGGKWSGPLLLEPPFQGLDIRQSTVPDIDSKARPERVRIASDPKGKRNIERPL